MEMIPAWRSLAYAGGCFAIGFFITGIWPESEVANATKLHAEAAKWPARPARVVPSSRSRVAL
jgi:hypothetical protein